MHRLRAKSAPPGRSKSKKTTAIKEIEEWVFSGKEHELEASRIHSGQLAENITEERLLRSHMLELGKERFKIKSKYEHDIQTFKDKQKRKGFRIKFNRPHSASVATDRMVCVSGRSAQSINRSNDRPSSSRVLITPVIRPKTVQFKATRTHGEHSTTDSTETRPRTVPNKTALQNPPSSVEEWAPIAMSADWSRPSTAGPGNYSRSTSSVGVPSYNGLRNKRTDLTGLTQEPRFSALEKVLSSNYASDCKADVPTLIQKIEALRRTTQLGGQNARREMDVKIRIFMAENKIVF